MATPFHAQVKVGKALAAANISDSKKRFTALGVNQVKLLKKFIDVSDV